MASSPALPYRDAPPESRFARKAENSVPPFSAPAVPRLASPCRTGSPPSKLPGGLCPSAYLSTARSRKSTSSSKRRVSGVGHSGQSPARQEAHRKLQL